SEMISASVRDQAILNIESLSSGDLPAGRWDEFKNWEVEGLVLLPLIAEDRLIGAMMMARSEPWLLDAQEKRFYRLLGNQLAIAIEKARLHRREKDQLQIEKELALSRQVQTSMLPQAIPQLDGWQMAFCYQPAREVGGDFYDYFELPDDGNGAREWGLVVADVADKGMPAAIFMALSRVMIRSAAFMIASPASALQRANRTILQEAGGSLFLTAFYARLDPLTGRLRFSNAGHNRPLWVKAGGEVVELTTQGTVLGVLDDILLGEDEIQVSPGDSVVLYTDGIIEAVDQNDQLFGRRRLDEAVRAAPGSRPQQLVDAIVTAVEQFAGEIEQSDDVTVLVVRRNPK
ncbi:MAG: SpoIIE family protein phosphatase, partial [Anaerolineales bacterium]|nr:SpoIIE family protein phosphatase [Anaerolineales bacterium]